VALCLGCNMTMRRAVIERLGFFDENFGPGSELTSGEDLDYIYRAYIADITVEYVPDMIVSHFHSYRSQSEGRKFRQQVPSSKVMANDVYRKLAFY
jgi:GT2 family glycosyltransferase